MKGWLDRVWTPGFAYDLTAEAWRGDINGRQPKLTHKKALIIQTTIFDKRAYDAGLREAMRMVIDEFTLTYPGIRNVEHEYFYAPQPRRLSTDVTVASHSVDERKSKAGHLLAVANQENVANEDWMVPGLARERRNPGDLGESVWHRLHQRQIAVLGYDE